MNFLLFAHLIVLTSIVNGHLHTNEENPQWKINLRSELESKMQTMFTNFSKQYKLIKNQQLKLFLDSLGTDIKNTVKIQVDNDHDHEHEDSHDHEHDHSHQESPSFNVNCLRTKLDEIFNFVKLNDDNKTDFNSSRFLSSCPYFAYSLASCFSQKLTHKIEYKSVVSAFVSAIVITIIGILCYLVVPSIESEKFKYFFQFLVALAVGTLSGDSLLHLIPHAFIDHDQDHKEHVHDSAEVYKGLAAVAGIYIFFLIEKVMMIRRARKEKQHKEIEKNYDGNLEVATSSDKTAADQSYYMIHANKDLKYIAQYLPNNPCNVDIEHHDSENEVKHFHKHALSTDASNLATASSHGSYCSSDTESKLIPPTSNPKCMCTPEISYAPKKSHEHGHSHGHSHKHHIYKSDREKAHHDHHKKHEKELTDIKLIAWMVLMGDGLHNFADGLAIGVSFGSSLTTGFGTAIAVLCHELPHEIGDFAVLRRAGVSLKKALFFNAISGILCMFGVLVGLLIGGFVFFTNLSYMFIAGTFLYISLVDMIPELSENKEDDSIANFLIQSLGILIGVGVMALIAIFESDIQHMFDH